MLFHAGDAADGGYVVQEGSFELRPQRARRDGEIVAGPGTLLGELALITETKRPATAIAREPSTVIRISRSLFLKMLEGYPDAAGMRCASQIASRAPQQSMRARSRDVRALLDSQRSAALDVH